METIGEATLFLIAWISCLVLITAWKNMYKKNNLPPGPIPLPIIGNLLQIKSGDIVNGLIALREKYGDVFTVYLGSRRIIVVCGYNAVKEALIDQGEDFSGRGKAPTFDKVYKNHGIAFTSNMERWKQLRRFSLLTMKNFGMGKRCIEDRIQEESQCLLEELKKTNESPIFPRNYFGAANANIICSIMFGNRYDYQDPEFNTLVWRVNDCFHLVSSFWGQMYDTFPYVMDYIPGPHHQIFKHLEDLLEFTAKRVKMNQETLDPDNPRDYIDCFLIKIKESQNTATEFDMTNLLTSTVQIFFAGFETVGTTLTYAFLILLKYPDVKEKVHEEIDQVIGRHRRVCLEDKIKMPYTAAVVQEIQRFITLVPFGVPHSVIRTTQFRGYTIPMNTDVLFMLCSVLWDPEQFTSPEKFNPRNFLNEDGSFKINDAFMPFSAGKRICIAKGMVNMELFLFISAILQEFDIKPVVELQELNLKPITSGFGNFPQAYQISFIPRSLKVNRSPKVWHI